MWHNVWLNHWFSCRMNEINEHIVPMKIVWWINTRAREAISSDAHLEYAKPELYLKNSNVDLRCVILISINMDRSNKNFKYILIRLPFLAAPFVPILPCQKKCSLVIKMCIRSICHLYYSDPRLQCPEWLNQCACRLPLSNMIRN